MDIEKPDDALTIGELVNRLPPTGEWVDLPQYGVRVRVWADRKPDAEFTRRGTQ